MSIYAEAPPLLPRMSRPRASTYCNRPLPPVPPNTESTRRRRRSTKTRIRNRLSHFPTPPPSLLPREEVDALSLQDTSFLYILSNVDQYPVELLGLLPLHWRRALIEALPPFRLYQLEGTALAKGIETDEVWKSHSKRQDCVWGDYLKDGGGQEERCKDESGLDAMRISDYTDNQDSLDDDGDENIQQEPLNDVDHKEQNSSQQDSGGNTDESENHQDSQNGIDHKEQNSIQHDSPSDGEHTDEKKHQQQSLNGKEQNSIPRDSPNDSEHTGESEQEDEQDTSNSVTTHNEHTGGNGIQQDSLKDVEQNEHTHKSASGSSQSDYDDQSSGTPPTGSDNDSCSSGSGTPPTVASDNDSRSHDSQRRDRYKSKRHNVHHRRKNDARSRFMNYLSHLLFNEMNRDYACKRVTELLHAIHIDTLDKTVANALVYGHINSLFMFQPPYYLIPFRCPNLTERELYWLLHCNKMLPTSLELYVYNLDSSPLWTQETISQEMMRRLFSRLKFLRLYNHMSRIIQLEEIMNAVTHSSQYKEQPSDMGSLTHLEFLRADDRHLSTIVPFFSAPMGYSNLTSITISMSKPIHYILATRHLGPIIRHQLSTLRHLELCGFSCSISRNTIHMCDFMFFSTLVSFILKPHFRTLTLQGFTELPWKMLRMLLEANLRTVPSHTQTITFRDVSVTTRGELPFMDTGDSEDDEEENQFYPAAESKCLDYKRILFKSSRIPIEVLEWLETTDRVCVNTLEFSGVKFEVTTPPPASMGSRLAGGLRAGLSPFLRKSYGSNNGHRYRKSIEYYSEKDLKNRLLRHRHFDCCMFKWEDVSLDTSYVLRV